MRLGGRVFKEYSDPESWVAALRHYGYSAAGWHVRDEVDFETVKAYAKAAQEADIIIAEVGAWSNPLSHDEEVRLAALEKCKNRLALADEIGAYCCLNESGFSTPNYPEPGPEDLAPETFDLVVDMVREIIDAVKPKRTFYTLETHPRAYPDSPDSYLALIKAIDRKQFAVHLDPVNLINSPSRYFNTAPFLRECFSKLGPYIKSCHAKDTLMSRELTTHLDEVACGKGNLDYHVYVKEMGKLGRDIPMMMEHMRTEEEFADAAKFIRTIAKEVDVEVL